MSKYVLRAVFGLVVVSAPLALIGCTGETTTPATPPPTTTPAPTPAPGDTTTPAPAPAPAK